MGDDTLQGDAGDDLLIGGEGTGDLVSYASLSEFGQNVVVNLTSSWATGAAGSDFLQGIEHVLTGAGDDQLIGNTAANYLSAGSGRDVMWGEAGADTLDGGEGDDTLYGGESADSMAGNGLSQNFQGGAGDDVILAGGGSLADILTLFNI